jgi:anti-sigma regulatory factor (Ser/Thr protein kinase)
MIAKKFDNEITLDAKVDCLDMLLDWTGDILEKNGCSGQICNQIAVVTEELFVNIASYAYKTQDPARSGDATIRLSVDKTEIAMQFEDAGVAFNPLEYETPDVTADIEERKIGGLGIYLTRKWMNSVEYERTPDGKNVLSIIKNL